MVIVILEHTVCLRCYVASHFPLNRVHLLDKMAGKVAPVVTSKLISVNCITQCVK